MFNYRLFLHSKSEFPDYKFRVYIDKKSFYENKELIFYLSYLKKLEIELCKSDKIDYEWLELILCQFTNPEYNKSLLMCLRFLPFFEGCECHSRDLDFRLSSYDIQVIYEFNKLKYPIYFCSYANYNGILNPFLGGCWGGNINNMLMIRKDSKFNSQVLKFFSPKCFIAICIIYSNMYNIQFGIDEIILRLYMDLLSDIYIDNCVIFGSQIVNLVREYMANQYICTNKIQKFNGIILIYGLSFNTEINIIIEGSQCPLVTGYRFDELSDILKIKTEQDIHNFLNEPNNGLQFFRKGKKTVLEDIAKFVADDINLMIDGKESYFADTLLDEVIALKYSPLEHSTGTYKPKDDIVTDAKQYNEFYEKIHCDFYSMISSPIRYPNNDKIVSKSIEYSYNEESINLFSNNILKFNTIENNNKIIDRKFNVNRIIIPSYNKNNFSKYKIESDESVKFDSHIFKHEIEREIEKDEIQIISIPINSIIKSFDGTIIFDISKVAESSKLKCREFINYDSLNNKFIYFTKSKIIFMFIFNSISYDEYVENKDNICGFGKTYLSDLNGKYQKCNFYMLDKLKFYDKDNNEFNPLEIKTGGQSNYYLKYIKYKHKYLLLKNKK
jgi:hypothetical protein